MPEIVPLPERLSPGGSVPEVSAYEYGPLPPEAERFWLYDDPSSPPGRDGGVIVMVGQLPMVME